MSSSAWKEIVKNGWHPEKDGGSIIGSVKGLVGKGDKSSEREEHVVTPISSLRDPSSFGPPPKHVAAYGSSASPTRTASPSSSAHNLSRTTTPVASHTQQAQAHHVVDEPPAEPKPYRVNTTGLSTSHLPPPPGRVDGAGGRVYTPTSTIQAPSTAKPKVPPSLPPRLPPRSGGSTPNPTSSIGQITGHAQLNQGAINRLGAAGISVPGLGIGGDKTPTPTPTLTASSPQLAARRPAPGYGQVDELQARFARMDSSLPSQASGSATSFVSPRQSSVAPVPSVMGKKKPPPPPKKPELSGTRNNTGTPPPVPLATRPTFN